MVIDTKPRTLEPPRPGVGVRWGTDTLELRDAEVFGSGSADLCARFLHSVFSVEEVRSVQIDRPRATAVIQYEHGKLRIADLLQRLALAIRGSASASAAGKPRHLGILPPDLSRPKITIHRHRGILSTWEVIAERPGLLSLRHDLVTANPPLARRIAHQIELAHGVQSSVIGALTGTLKIRFDPAQTRTERLLRALDAAPESLPLESTLGIEPAPVRFGLVNAAVALSFVSDFLVPSTWPATAGLLVGANLGMFRQAATQLGQGHVGLPVLFTTIAASTLASGQFLPWAVMNWMFKFWSHRYQHQLAIARRRLLGDVVQQQRFARIEAVGGLEVEVPSERLAAGDVILVSPGEKLSVDGRILRGHGLFDERVVRGASGMTRKGPEELVHAGSIVMSGDFLIETRGQENPTRAATLARIALAAATHPPGIKTSTLKGEAHATRMVIPTLATAGIGYSLGGLPMALAILDTDFASGPGLAYSLESLQALAVCFQQGIVVRDPDALERLGKVDVLLLEHLPSLETAEPEVASLRVFPGHTEFQILRYAASAFRDLDDERAVALLTACRSRRIRLLDHLPISYGTDLTLMHREQVIKVGNLGGQGPAQDSWAARHGRTPARPIDSLMVGINGQIAGLIDFRLSSRLLAAGAIKELRARVRHPLAIGLVSHAADAQVRRLAAGLGVDFHHGGLSNHDLGQLIRGCRKRSLKVAYVGQCLARTQAARAADVAVSVDADGLDQAENNPAQVVLLRPDLEKLGTLNEVTRVHRRNILVARGSAFIPNVCCMAGAFLLGISSMATVIITNLGTLSTYARTASSIRGLERQLARVSGRLREPIRSRKRAPR
jgi:cation transport ATPase